MSEPTNETDAGDSSTGEPAPLPDTLANRTDNDATRPDPSIPVPGEGHGHDGPVTGRKLAGLCLVALGVVYGDIGTSPLYAMRECFHGPSGVAITQANVLGVLSLIVWALILVISIKYVAFVLRADNEGEGGVLALMAKLSPLATRLGRRRHGTLIMLGLFGAALLYGDGMITPAISVLGALEGIEVLAPDFEHFIVPTAIAVLIVLFLLQKRGTAAVGSLFGPVMIVWFAVLALLGIGQIVHEPGVLMAFNPWYALRFFMDNGWMGYGVLGAVFLVVTGGEALYADMGHFGARPIRIVWYGIVLPCLLLNYFGQGALLIEHAVTAHENTFYSMAPRWALIPLIGLATLATVIASQAVISGVFSLTMQAIQLGYLPRMKIDHTSAEQIGQIYIAPMNWLLLVAACGLVVGFQTSGNLAAAYGIAVTITMVITTFLMFILFRRVWKWNPWAATLLCLLFGVIDIAFLGANITKITDGGWFPLVVAGSVFLVMTTWKRGRKILGDRVRERLMATELFLEDLRKHPVHRVKGTAVFLTGNSGTIPLALTHNIKHNRVVHEHTVLLSIVVEEISHVKPGERIEAEDLGDGFTRVVAHVGFMEDIVVPLLLREAGRCGAKVDVDRCTYFLGRETPLATKRPGMALWPERLFVLLSRNAQPVTAFFHLPHNRVIEVGSRIEV